MNGSPNAQEWFESSVTESLFMFCFCFFFSFLFCTLVIFLANRRGVASGYEG